MANRLNLPEDLELLVEKREKDRRQQELHDEQKSASNDHDGQSANDRRHGLGRRAEDRG